MNEVLQENLAGLSIKELTAGVRNAGDALICVVCGMAFQNGVVYPSGGQLLEARLALTRHISRVHGGMLKVLSELSEETNGLTDIQRTVIMLLGEEQSDREIAKALGGKAESTVRNHRYHLRRRITEAKILSAIGALLSVTTKSGDEFITFHDDIPTRDERIVTTRSEAEAILARYVDTSEGFRLTKFPRKEKEKLVLLKRITAEFERTRTYTEPEVNQILKPIYDDYVTVRRYLIEYRFLERKPGGAEYWVHA